MAHIGDFKPLLIRVRAFDWEAIPETVPPTPRDEFLLREIKIQGGIDLTVGPGLYLFNVTPGPNGGVVTLVPYKHEKKLF